MEIAKEYVKISFQSGEQHVYLLNNPDDIEELLFMTHVTIKKN